MRALTGRLPLRIRDRLDEAMLRGVDELRLRAGQPIELRRRDGSVLVGAKLTADELNEAVRALADHSIYACEEQFRQGYFSLPGGVRVGLTGTFAQRDGEAPALTHVGSISIRVAREIAGAADSLMPRILCEGRPLSTLILSAPMLGKTTMLRDIARQLAGRGLHVAISDERSELAGCREGVPQLDVGVRTDVCDGLPKRLAIPQLVRAMSPEALVTDELGHAGDAEAVAEAVRSGVSVMASAHADSYSMARGRVALAPLFEDKLFRRVVLLAGTPGRVEQVLNEEGKAL